jgi:hypothetical protein
VLLVEAKVGLEAYEPRHQVILPLQEPIVGLLHALFPPGLDFVQRVAEPRVG